MFSPINKKNKAELQKDRLTKILEQYRAKYHSNVFELLQALTDKEIWRFFIDGHKQNAKCDGSIREVKFNLLKGLKITDNVSLDMSVSEFMTKYSLTAAVVFGATPFEQKLSLHDLIVKRLGKKAHERGWAPFEEREPGYLLAVINMFIELLKHYQQSVVVNKQPITLDLTFTERIHGVSLKDVKHTNYDKQSENKLKSAPGQIRVTSSIYYPIWNGKNASIAGIKEFIAQMKKGKPYYSFSIASGKGNQPFLIYDNKNLQNEEKFLALFEQAISLHLQSDAGRKPEDFVVAKAGSIVSLTDKEEKAVKSQLDSTLATQNKILPEDQYKRLLYLNIAKAVQQKIKNYLQGLIRIFDQGIQIAQKNEAHPLDVLRIITKHTQDCERLHAHNDANCRLHCMGLLNYYLIAFGFPMVIQDDPNVFDGFHVDEIVDRLLTGMESCLALAEMQEKKLYGVTTSELYQELSDTDKVYFNTVIQTFSKAMNELRSAENEVSTPIEGQTTRRNII